jgi:CHASE2 domain-containing sensor protein
MFRYRRNDVGRAEGSICARLRYFKDHFCCRLRANVPMALPLTLGLLLLLVLDPFSFTSYADRISRDLFVKLQSPFYDSDVRDDITLVLFHENELPIFSGGDAHWPPTFKEYALIIDQVLKAGPRAVFVDLLFMDGHATGSFLVNHGIDPAAAEASAGALAEQCRKQAGCQPFLPGIEALRSEVLGELVRAVDADRLDCFATHALAGWLGTATKPADCRGWTRYGRRAEAPFVLAAPPPVSISALGVLAPGDADEAADRGTGLHGGLHPLIESAFPAPLRHPHREAVAEDWFLDALDAFAKNPYKANVVTLEVEDRYSLALTPEPGMLKGDPDAVTMDAYCRPRAVLSAAARLYLESRCGQLASAEGAERRALKAEIRAFSRRITARDRAQITIQWGLRPNPKSTGSDVEPCFPAATGEPGGGVVDGLLARFCGNGWCGLDAFVELLRLGVNSDPEPRSLWDHPQPARCAYHRQMTASQAFQSSLFGQTEAFEDKYVIIGASAQAARDFHNTPTHGAVPGAFFHAMALDNLLANDGRYMRSAYQRTWGGLTFSLDMFAEAITIFFIALLFFPRNVKPVLQGTIPWQQWLCRLQMLTRSMLLALLVVLAVVIVCASVFDLTPVNWISLLAFTFGIFAFRASDLGLPLWNAFLEVRRRLLVAAIMVIVLSAAVALAWLFTGWTLLTAGLLLVGLCLWPLPTKHRPPCKCGRNGETFSEVAESALSRNVDRPPASARVTTAHRRRRAAGLKRQKAQTDAD